MFEVGGGNLYAQMTDDVAENLCRLKKVRRNVRFLCLTRVSWRRLKLEIKTMAGTLLLIQPTPTHRASKNELNVGVKWKMQFVDTKWPVVLHYAY